MMPVQLLKLKVAIETDDVAVKPKFRFLNSF